MVDPWCHLSSSVSRGTDLSRYGRLYEHRKCYTWHRYPYAVMGVPIIVSTLSDNVVGMRLRGVIRFLCRNFDLSKYLSLYPLSANGTLCNNFRYLLVLFLALSYFSLRRILAYFYGKVNESLVNDIVCRQTVFFRMITCIGGRSMVN